MPSSDPLGHHDWHSQQYVEEWITSAAMRDDTRRLVLRRVASLIPHEPDAAIRVLDVGAGYGALSAQVLARFPNARLVCQDFSEPMFAHARKRLASALDRVTFAKSDLDQPDWTRAVTGPFDTVVSAIAIHNVRYPERIRAIYAEIVPLLAPGGCFLNADLIFPSGRTAAEAYHRMRRLENWIRTGKEATGGPEAAAQEISAAHGQRHGHAEPWARDIEPASLERQLHWLQEAGLQDVECFWKEMQSAIMGGFRPL